MNALCWSAAIRNEGMTKYLLDHGGDTIIAGKIAGGDNSGSPRVEKNRTLVKQVLAEGPNLTVTSLTAEGYPCAVPALHQALLMSCSSLAKLLIEEGADVTTWSQGYSALHHAALTRDETIVDKLLEKGADVTVVNPKGVTPLHLAAVYSNEAVLKILLRHGADTMSTDVHGGTPISLLMCCSTLIPRKPRESSPHDRGEDEDSLKHLEKFSKIRLMLEQGNVAYKDRVGNTGLHRAAILGDVALVRVLLQRGANIKARGPKERTALHLAAISGSSAIIRDMVENYGADFMARDRFGNTPLHLAIQYKRRGTTRLLIWMGADVDVKDKCGRTAMHWAAGMGDVDAVKLLLSKGASVTVRDNDERTPLFLAAEPGHVSVVKILVDNGADIDTQDKYGETVPALVVSEVLDHPERCFAGSQSIPMGKWPRREQYWGVWYNIPEKTSGRRSHRVLCNPGQHIFRPYIMPVNMRPSEDDEILPDAGNLFEGN